MKEYHDELSQEQLTYFGKRLRALRKEKGYSNYESFAHEVGISRIQYGKYENGANITLVSLIKILKGLDMTFAEFFGEGFGEMSEIGE